MLNPGDESTLVIDSVDKIGLMNYVKEYNLFSDIRLSEHLAPVNRYSEPPSHFRGMSQR